MDTSWITLGTGLVAGLGIGSVITAQIQHALKLKEAAPQSQRQALEARYKVVTLITWWWPILSNRQVGSKEEKA